MAVPLVGSTVSVGTGGGSTSYDAVARVPGSHTEPSQAIAPTICVPGSSASGAGASSWVSVHVSLIGTGTPSSAPSHSNWTESYGQPPSCVAYVALNVDVAYPDTGSRSSVGVGSTK